MTNTTTAIADAFGTTPRTLRKFLRSDASGIESVGKGSRYALPSTKREVAALRKRFDAWGAAQVEAKAKRDETPADPEGDAPSTDGPTDAELDAIDAE